MTGVVGAAMVDHAHLQLAVGFSNPEHEHHRPCPVRALSQAMPHALPPRPKGPLRSVHQWWAAQVAKRVTRRGLRHAQRPDSHMAHRQQLLLQQRQQQQHQEAVQAVEEAAAHYESLATILPGEHGHAWSAADTAPASLTLDPTQISLPQASRPSDPTTRAGRPLQRLRRAMRICGQTLLRQLRPWGHGHNDLTAHERIANILTCGPFFAVGTCVLRKCRAHASRRFGFAFLFVGGAAATYHASWGPTRQLMRFCDYWSIAAASGMLRTALCTSTPGSRGQGLGLTLVRASNILIPFHPSLVSMGNLLISEARCMHMMRRAPEIMLGSWLRHVLCAVAAGGIFFSEDMMNGHVPGVHAAWHVFAALGMITTTPFLVAADSNALARG